MRIAINTRFLISDKMEGFGWYTYEITKRIVENHPEHEFLFFFDRSYNEQFVFSENVTPIVLSPPARHPILFRIWFNFSVTRALKKYNADLFLSPDGYLSLRTKVPQVGVIHDINFEHFPEDLPKSARNYLRTFFPKFARKADHIITVSEYSKQDISSAYSIASDKITVSWNGASDAFHPISETQKKAVRERTAGGDPYFLFVGALHPRKNLVRLLGAYQTFIEQHPTTTFKLVIVGEAMWKGTSIASFDTEKMRERIIFTGHLTLDELAQVMGAASIFTFVPYFEGFGIPLVEAMRCGIPILSGDKTSLPEVGGDAVLYCDPFDEQDILEKLTQLANDNELQSSLSKKGLERSQLFSWDTSANNVWKVIENVLGLG